MDPPPHYAPSYRLLCPRERCENDKDSEVTIIGGQVHHKLKTSYLISDAEDEKTKHLHSMFSRNKFGKGEKELYCSVCYNWIIDKTYHSCSYCKDAFHNECVKSTPEFYSADHPKHSLQLFCFYNGVQQHVRQCCSCRNVHGHIFYYCSICDFMIHPFCAGKRTPLTIHNPKRHKHTLHYFPRISALVCDVCGLEGNIDIDYFYVCLLCDFIVHKCCVYIPYVIKVSLHNHRLTFTYTLPFEKSTDCGVCHTKISEYRGEYSCKKGCVYAVHSRCAMQKEICDGKELEGEPEETYENTKMFEEKGDGIIQHSAHPSHQLRLENKFHDESKHCQACRLPSYNNGGHVYRCLQCDNFILHESCAYIPRVNQFMIHVHPLTIEVKYTSSWFRCKKCYRYSCGYAYVCRRYCYGEFDILCASISQPFDYHSHPHPLFITSGNYKRIKCSICPSMDGQPLTCVKCDFVLCFRCATFPHKVRYKHDEHLLVFSYEEDAKLYGCEICEKDIINSSGGLYACKECKVTIHTECLLGKDPYMTPGSYRRGLVIVLPNTGSTRPICKTCRKRCPYKIKIETPPKGGPYCSFECFHIGYVVRK